MKKVTKILLILVLIIPMLVLSTGILAQVQVSDLKKEQDTLKENVGTLRDKISGVEERISNAEADLAKLTKIKLSGYIQAQFLHYEASSVSSDNIFMLRRVRVKFQYAPTDGVAFVLQPDFTFGKFVLKDAYVQLNDRWLKTFSLWAGRFNRPAYEVEYSSSSREVPERSRVIRAIYPDERAIGAKLEIAPPSVPLKIQLALFNGNDGLTIPDASGNNINPENNDFDNHKDFMGRVTYTFKLGQIGALGIGAHGYYGKIKANTMDVLNADYTYNKAVDNTGKLIRKNWVGFEGQLYFDFLGGLALKGEYIFGVNGTPGYSAKASVVSPMTSALKNDTLTLTTLTTNTTNSRPAIEKSFSGYYIYLIKNIGKRHQVAVRYDYYDPNTKVASDQIGIAKWDAGVKTVTTNNFTYVGTDPVIATNTPTKTIVSNSLKSGAGDIKYQTITLAYSYYFDDNIKIMLAYEIPMNLIKQNILTLRLQAKF
ncbi:MAG: porin [Bacteroidales bacterium]|nr:porin [Bacteroidales bacterium]